MKKVIIGLLFLLASTSAFSQAVVRGEASPGVYQNIATDGNQRLLVSTSGVDPCASSNVTKSSAVVNVSAAATTALVAPSGSTTVYVCSFVVTISQVATTANTLKFVQGTGAACVTGPSDLTGLYGAGGVTAGAPITIESGSGVTLFKTAAGGGLCATTAIGASGSFQGFVSYVQQ